LGVTIVLAIAILILILILAMAVIRVIKGKRRRKPVDTTTGGVEKQPTNDAENPVNDDAYSTVDVTLGKS
jgi:hypothetical protein